MRSLYNRKFLLGQLCAVVLLCAPAYAQTPMIVAPDGKYLGNLNLNRYDPNSVANPYGPHGSRYSPDSVNNPYGQYGSRYSPDSARNPYAIGPQQPPR
jgi:hypothetical protein